MMTMIPARYQTPVGQGFFVVWVMAIYDNVAICKDRLGRIYNVRTDVKRAKGLDPDIGEMWYVDRDLGMYTFAAYVGRNPGFDLVDFNGAGTETQPLDPCDFNQVFMFGGD